MVGSCQRPQNRYKQTTPLEIAGNGLKAGSILHNVFASSRLFWRQETSDTDKHHRFGDLYRWLNQDVLRLCFFRLRKDAASGVDGVTYQEYEKNL